MKEIPLMSNERDKKKVAFANLKHQDGFSVIIEENKISESSGSSIILPQDQN